ncbi:cysteine desulfurase NifS [bacterium]|nr:cysteine desulfurase NifS [bacterium]MBU1153722.1 cysteine desulfurase NifS [bacterium]
MEVYLDNNATTKVDPEVLEEMMPYFSETYGNPSSIHHFGRKAREAVDKGREQVARLLGAQPEEIIFTSGGTESNNLAIKGYLLANPKKGKHLITSAIEHSAVLNSCQELKKQGYDLTIISVNEEGLVNLEEIKEAIRDETVLISIMHANNEVGSIQPLLEIAEIVKNYDLGFHVDAVQSVGKIGLNVKNLNVDLLSLSGHKLYGPKGVGALYIRKGIKVKSLQQGGHHERNIRAGTENVPGIVGLGKACEIAGKNSEKTNAYISNLRNKLYRGIKEKISEIKLNGNIERSLLNTLNISFAYVEGESLLLRLDNKGISCSAGSACASESLKPSHVLMAMNVPSNMIQGSLRFSLGKYNREEEIEYTLNILPKIVQELREMSPLYQKKDR